MAALTGPIIGREVELGELDELLGALKGGASACVAIEGEPGIGKTRLLSELGRRAEAQRHASSSPARPPSSSAISPSACGPTRSMPMSPRRRSTWTDADAALELGGDPSLAASFRRSDAGSRWPTSATAATERSAGCSSCSAADRPLVLVLDDLHWSDGASIELIAALLRRGPDAPILFALAFRPSQAPGRLSAALAVPSVRRIKLGELSEDQARELLGDLEPRAVAAIYRHGGGNPFYLEQLARAGEDAWRPAAPGGNGGRTGVPAAVAASLAEELASLSDDAARAARGRRRRRRAVRARPRGSDRRAAGARRRSPRSTRCWRSISCARPRCRGASSSATRSCAARSTSRRRAAGGSRLTRARRPRWPRAAPTPPSAPTTSSSPRARATRTPSRCCCDAGAATAPRAPAAAAHWFEAALRLLPARGPRAPGRRAGRARRGAALAGRARALPRRPAGGARPASRRRAGAAASS